MALFTAKLPSLGALSTRERGILALALIVAGVFFVTRGLPLVQEAYAARADSIDSVLLDIECERRLLNTEASWEQKRRETEAKLAAAEAAGEVSRFEAHRDALLGAVKTLNPR